MKINAYILAADPAWIEASVLSYYDHVERIIVSYDASGLGWTRTPIDVEQCIRRLRAIDSAGKCEFVPGSFQADEFVAKPLNGETFQRQAAIDHASRDADWVLQLDSDEVLGDPQRLIDCIGRAHAGGFDGLEYPSRWLYRRANNGLYLEQCRRGWRTAGSYPGCAAVRAHAKLRVARQGPKNLYRVDFARRNTDPSHACDALVHEAVRLDQGIFHYSWVRPPAAMDAKAIFSGHAHDFDWAPLLAKWNRSAGHPWQAALFSQRERGNRKRHLRMAAITLPAHVSRRLPAGFDLSTGDLHPNRDTSHPTPRPSGCCGGGARLNRNEPITFSVIIATFNRCELIQQAIQSVLEQSDPAAEVIVVVDGSSDGTADMVRSTFPAVRVIEQPNLGPSIAHNAGVAASQGNWICFLDDDDLWHREKLKITRQYIAEHDDCLAVRNPVWFFSTDDAGSSDYLGVHCDFTAADLAACHAAALSTHSNNRFDYLEIRGDSHKLLLENSRGVLSSSVIRRDILIAAGAFCPSQTCGDDWTMFLNVARLTEWHTIPLKLGFTRLHKAQNSTNVENGLYILAGKVNAWHTGRALPERAGWAHTLKRLEEYGPVYRQQVQAFFWQALRAGQFRTAGAIRALGALLLPRWRDRIYTMVPPPLTWRVERYLLGMHK